MKMTMLKNIALATSVAVLFVALDAAPVHAAGDDARVKCENSAPCKNQAACRTPTDFCKTQNACEGFGMVERKSEEACADAQQLARDLLDQSNKSG